MIRIFQEASYLATKQIFRASNLDSIPDSLFWFHEFFLLFQKLWCWLFFWKILRIGTVFELSVWFNFLSNPSKQITIICLKNRTIYIEFSLHGKTVGLLENSYRKRALVLVTIKKFFCFFISWPSRILSESSLWWYQFH